MDIVSFSSPRITDFLSLYIFGMEFAHALIE